MPTIAIDRSTLRTLVPHAGDMCLLDAVIDWSAERIVCMATSHTQISHPLRHDNLLNAVILIEYVAQAAAAHGALVAAVNHADAKPQSGMLASIREATFYRDRVDDLDESLEIDAVRRLAQRDGAIYDFTVRSGAVRLADGRIAIALLAPERIGA